MTLKWSRNGDITVLQPGTLEGNYSRTDNTAATVPLALVVINYVSVL